MVCRQYHSRRGNRERVERGLGMAILNDELEVPSTAGEIYFVSDAAHKVLEVGFVNAPRAHAQSGGIFVRRAQVKTGPKLAIGWEWIRRLRS